MTEDRLVLLGTKGGPAINPGGSMPTASLLVLDGQKILVDCGLGVTRGLVDHGLSLKELDTIFITHLHSDHYLELGPLLHTAWTAGLNHGVQLFGPDGIQHYWRHFLAAMEFDIDIRVLDEGRPDLPGMIGIQILTDNFSSSTGGVEVSAMINYHPPLEESFALKFIGKQSTVVFSGDTAYLETMSAFAKGADVLVHEALLPAGVDRLVERVGNVGDRLRQHLLASHTTAAEAGRVAHQAEVGTLVINHKVPADDTSFSDADWEEAVRETWQGNLHIGRDGFCIPLASSAR